MMEIISEFGTVHFYGVQTLTTAIFSVWFELGDLGSAAYLSAIATGIVLTILIVDKIAGGKAKHRVDVGCILVFVDIVKELPLR
jgi:iron(III) transport system permease protein